MYMQPTLESLLRALGITPKEFEVSERAAFELAPRAWLERKLVEQGWVRSELAAQAVVDARLGREVRTDGLGNVLASDDEVTAERKVPQ